MQGSSGREVSAQVLHLRLRQKGELGPRGAIVSSAPERSQGFVVGCLSKRMGSRRSGALPLRRIRSPLVSSISPLTGAGIGPALLVPDRFVVCPRLPLGL